MRGTLLAAVLAGTTLGLAGAAHAKWTPTPVPQRPLLPSRGALMYDDPGAYIRIAKGAHYWIMPRLPLPRLYQLESDWLPIGSSIDVRIPPSSTLAAYGPSRTVMPAHIDPGGNDSEYPHLGGSRCIWTAPAVLDALSSPTFKRTRDRTRTYSWRVRGTNRGNELFAEISPTGRRSGGQEMMAINYSNAAVRVTIRCAPSGPQEPLVHLAPGVLVANPWVELQAWPAPGYPDVKPPAGERWQCADSKLAPYVGQACQALGWS